MEMDGVHSHSLGLGWGLGGFQVMLRQFHTLNTKD